MYVPASWLTFTKAKDVTDMAEYFDKVIDVRKSNYHHNASPTTAISNLEELKIASPDLLAAVFTLGRDKTIKTRLESNIFTIYAESEAALLSILDKFKCLSAHILSFSLPNLTLPKLLPNVIRSKLASEYKFKIQIYESMYNFDEKSAALRCFTDAHRVSKKLLRRLKTHGLSYLRGSFYATDEKSLLLLSISVPKFVHKIYTLELPQ
jgi:hypothetical protein